MKNTILIRAVFCHLWHVGHDEVGANAVKKTLDCGYRGAGVGGDVSPGATAMKNNSISGEV
jgi:hypothetical protein